MRFLGRLSPNLFLGFALIIFFDFLTGSLLGQTTSFWISGSGSFTNSVNWSAGVPNASSNAVFTNNATYTVSWTNSVTNANANFNNGTVTQDIASTTWVVTNSYTIGSGITDTAKVVHPAGTLVVTNGVGTGQLIVGSGGKGTYIITNGAKAFSDLGYLGFGTSSSNNNVLVTGSGSVWQSASIYIGFSGSSNTLTVNGSGAVVTNSVNLYVGNSNSFNSLIVSNGGAVYSTTGFVGAVAGSSNNNVVLTGNGSLWRNTSGLYVGSNAVTLGGGNVLIADGATLEANTIVTSFNNSDNITNSGGIFQFSSATPTITTNTANSIILTNGIISYRDINNANIHYTAVSNITFRGNNTFQLNNSTNAGILSYVFSNNNNQLYQNLNLVNGVTRFESTNINVGFGGKFLISNTVASIAGVVSNAGVVNIIGSTGRFDRTFLVTSIGEATGSVAISGGSVLVTNASLIIGDASSGNSLSISNGGTLSTLTGVVGNSVRSSNNLVIVNGSGSLWENFGDLTVGVPGVSNQISVSGSGTLRATNVVIGAAASAAANSIVLTSGNLFVTNGGSAALDIRGGNVTMNSGIATIDRLYMTNGASSVFTHNGGTLTMSFTTNTTASIFNVGDGATAATLILSNGTHHFATGVTVQNQGTLTVLGTLFGSPTILASGAALNGTGTLGPLVSSGNVSPGLGTAGTLTVLGAYTQNSGGALSLSFVSGSSYSKLNASGAGVLNGTITPTLLSGFNPSSGTIFTNVLTAAGNISGTFITVNDFSPTLTTTAIYGTTNVSLQAVRNFANPTLGLNLSQLGLANVLNTLFPSASGDLQIVLTEIGALMDPNDVKNAYNEILPQKFSTLPSLTLSSSVSQFQNLQLRLSGLRTGILGGFASIGEQTEYGKPILLAYNGSDLSGMLVRKHKKYADPRWSFFVNGSGSLGEQDVTVTQPGFKYTAAGLTTGLDYKLTQGFFAGFYGGYSRTATDLKGSGGTVNVDTFPVGLYQVFHYNRWYLNTSAGFAPSLYSAKRNIQFGNLNRVATSEMSGRSVNGFAEAGYEFDISHWTMGPTLSCQYTKLWIDGFTEKGADSLNLNVGGQQVQSLQSGIGWRIAYPWRVGTIRVVPQILGSYQYEFLNDSRSIQAQLAQGSDPFQVQTDAPERSFGLISGGISAELTEAMTLQLSYQSDLRRRDFNSQTLNGGMRLNF